MVNVVTNWFLQELGLNTNWFSLLHLKVVYQWSVCSSKQITELPRINGQWSDNQNRLSFLVFIDWQGELFYNIGHTMVDGSKSDKLLGEGAYMNQIFHQLRKHFKLCLPQDWNHHWIYRIWLIPIPNWLRLREVKLTLSHFIFQQKTNYTYLTPYCKQFWVLFFLKINLKQGPQMKRSHFKRIYINTKLICTL